jgi:predicted amidophosphoribosyltransferase
VFQSILEPIHCPEELHETHELCRFCLGLHPRIYQHQERCKFAQQNLVLNAGGWSTPASAMVLRSIRRNRSPYRQPVANLIHALLQELQVEQPVIVPMPMGSGSRDTGVMRDPWLAIVRSATTGISDAEIAPAIVRDKHQSVRQSLYQARRQIAHSEFGVEETLTAALSGRNVILLDDNVTTGATMIRCANLIQQFAPSRLTLLTVERNADARLLQRCPNPECIECEFYVPNKKPK